MLHRVGGNEETLKAKILCTRTKSSPPTEINKSDGNLLKTFCVIYYGKSREELWRLPRRFRLCMRSLSSFQISMNPLKIWCSGVTAYFFREDRLTTQVALINHSVCRPSKHFVCEHLLLCEYAKCARWERHTRFNRPPLWCARMFTLEENSFKFIWNSSDSAFMNGNLFLCLPQRYLAVTRPLTYSKRRRSKRLAMLMILIVWVLALAITCPPILGTLHFINGFPANVRMALLHFCPELRKVQKLSNDNRFTRRALVFNQR